MKTNKVISILDEYNLFDEQNHFEIEKCNKVNEFLNTFTYIDSRNNPLPKNIKRNDDGEILLNKIPFITSNIEIEDSHNNPEWLLLNNGSRIMVKHLLKDTCHYELLIMYFLRSLNIPCADYDIGIIDDEPLLICSSFLSSSDYIFNPFGYRDKEADISIENLLNYAKSNNFEEYLLKILFSDILYGNCDRFPNNFAMIKNNGIIRPAPLFDNGECIFYGSCTALPSLNGSYDIKKTIRYLLSYEEITLWVKNYMQNSNLAMAFELLKKEKGISPYNYIYQKFETFFKDSEQLVNDALKEKGEAFRIKLT